MTGINIGNLWMTQHCLRRRITNDGFPPIKINLLPDNSMEIRDGHHRVHWLWENGIRTIDKDRYDVYYTEVPKRRFWLLKDSPFLKRHNDTR